MDYSKRTIIVGDIHGCLEEFDELLRLVEFKAGADRLILCGDLVDRGPDSAGVVRRAMELRAESVLGNHEEWHLRYRRHARVEATDGKPNPMKLSEKKAVVQSTVGGDEWAWIEKLPNYIHVDEKWSVVHAGCKPGIAVEDQEPWYLHRLRYLRLDGKKPGSEVMTARTHAFWTGLWTGPRSIFYGHHPDKRGAILAAGPGHTEDVLSPEDWLDPWPGARTLGLDSGCCFGGRLTAAILDGEKIKIGMVSARGVHAKWHDDKFSATGSEE